MCDSKFNVRSVPLNYNVDIVLKMIHNWTDVSYTLKAWIELPDLMTLVSTHLPLRALAEKRDWVNLRTFDFF